MLIGPPVKSGLAQYPQDYKPSGAYYIANNISGLVEYTLLERQGYIKYLPKW